MGYTNNDQAKNTAGSFDAPDGIFIIVCFRLPGRLTTGSTGDHF